MKPFLDDQYRTAQAYFLCILGLVLVESLIRLPLYLIFLIKRGRPFITRPSPRFVVYILVQRLLTLPLPLPSFVTDHSFADLFRLAVFFGLNIIWAWNRVLYSTDFDQYGYLTIANGGLALLFGSRNNLFALVARVPSSTLLMYHRWVGRATVFYASLHLYGESRDWIKFGQVAISFSNTRIQVGLMTWLSLAIIFLTSLGVVRRVRFEVFYYSHALFIAYIIGALIHAEHAPEFLLPGLCLWILDRVVRFAYNFRPVQVTSVTQYQGEVIKFKVRGFKTTYPAQIAWIQIADVSFFNWHPFTVASAPGDDEATFLIRGLGRYTNRVHEIAKLSRSFPQEPAAESTHSLKFRVDGPYGVSHILWGCHPVTILVAGGAGITPGISIASYIIQRAGRSDTNVGDGQNWHVHLMWVVKDERHIDWFMEELKHLSALAASPTVQATFDVTIAVTGTTKSEVGRLNDSGAVALEEWTHNEYNGPGHLVRGRPNLIEWFQRIRSTRYGLDGAVNACGPRSLVHSARMAALKSSGKGGIFFVEEEVFDF